MKAGLEEIHTKALLDFLQKRELHPVEGLKIMSLAGLSIIASNIEFDMSPQEKTQLSLEVDSFSMRLRELVKGSTEDIFAMLTSLQVLNRELIEFTLSSFDAAKAKTTPKE